MVDWRLEAVVCLRAAQIVAIELLHDNRSFVALLYDTE